VIGERPYVRDPEDWQSFGPDIVEDPFVLEDLHWKEVGAWDEDARRWRVKGRWRKMPRSPWLRFRSETNAADFRIDFKFNRARDVHTIDKSMLGKLLAAEIRRHLTIRVGRHRGLETETTVHVRLDFLPCAD
jgi:hypothetical protein